MIFTEQTAPYSVRVFFLNLVLAEICTDNRCFFTAQSVIYEIIKRGHGELIDYLGTKVIYNEKIAVKVSVDKSGAISSLRFITVKFKLGEKVDSPSIENVVTLINNLLCKRA